MDGNAVIVVVLFLGCQGPQPAPIVTLTDESATTKLEVLRHIPVGTSIADAQSIMEASGCDCMKDSSEHGNYLYCYNEKSVKLTYGRIWKIFLYHKDGLVTDVSVTTGLVGF
jgi:hypothetical protein